MNKEKDITAKLHDSKAREVKLLYERGQDIEKAKEEEAWEKMGITESQYFQGELGITRVEMAFVADVYKYLSIYFDDEPKDFEGFTRGKLELSMREINKLPDGDARLFLLGANGIIARAKTLLYNDLRDELKGEADDGKCSPECDWIKEIKISYYCKTHKKRVYTDPRGNFLENFNKQYANSEIKAIKTREEFEALAEKLLSPKETKVLKLRFGWKSYSMMTLEEVAKEIKVTRERIRQITVKAIEKMRWDKDESN